MTSDPAATNTPDDKDWTLGAGAAVPRVRPKHPAGSARPGCRPAPFNTVRHQWDRPGRRSDGARFTIATFARYLLHDPVHHLHDVTG